MALIDDYSPLSIKTVGSGFYQGFNPVVSITTKVLVSLLVIALIAFPDASGGALKSLKEITLELSGTWYIYLLAMFPVFCFAVALIPATGRIVLGAPGDVPEHSTVSEALRTIRRLDRKHKNKTVDFANMLAAATIITAAALLRTESRGGHYRSDFPAPDAKQAQRSFLTLSEALMLRDAQ